MGLIMMEITVLNKAWRWWSSTGLAFVFVLLLLECDRKRKRREGKGMWKSWVTYSK